MIGLLAGLAAGFGALIGSFLNVVIYRMPRGEPMGMERSKCPKCGSQITWFDNVPLLSYLILRGRCRACKMRISFRYPLVEGLTAALFALVVFRVHARPDWQPAVLAWVVCCAFGSILVAASFIDMDQKLLPDKLTLRAGPIVALVGAVGVPAIPGTVLFWSELEAHMSPSAAGFFVGLVGWLVGGGVILLIRQLGTWVLKKEAMGLGDVKFMAMCGLLLGMQGVLLAIAVALVVGSVLGIGIWLVTRSKEIPFGPFLALGALAVLLYGERIEEFVLVTYPGWFSSG